MEKTKPYSNYKPSGIAWLGEIPEHWEIRKLKSLFKRPESLFIDGDWIESNNINGSDVKYITTGNIREGKYKEKGSGQITFETFKRLNCTEALENDILISRLNMPIGRCCLAPKFDKPLIVSVDVVICRLDIEYNRKYFVYLMNSKRYQESTALESRGATMKRVSRTILGNFFLSIPTKEEQTAIANFLDYKTAKIDRFIRKKKQLIKLLNEQKAGIINHAVTKGLDANAKMKPSGIEWLGDIPETWEVSRMKNICSVRQGLQIPISDRKSEKFENCLEYITIKSINNPDNHREYIFNPSKNVICKVDDILVVRTGGTGQVVTNITGVFHNNFFLVDYDRKKIVKEFFYYFLISPKIRSYLLLVAGTTTIPDLNHGEFYNTPFFEFDKTEQQQIVSHIEKETEKLNKAISTIEKEIALVQEYRTALIAEAVTGKIDVREYKVPVLEDEDLVYEEVEEELDMVAEDGEEYGMETE